MHQQELAPDIEALAEADHAGYAASMGAASVDRADIRRLNRHAARRDRPLVIIGTDTTALLAHWSRRHASKHPESECFTHFVGCTAESRRTERLLERLLLWLRRIAALPDPIPADPQARRELLPNWLARAAARRGLVLVLDRVEGLEDANAAQALDWLPDHLPPNVRLVAGAKKGVAAAEQLRQRGWQLHFLSDADDADATARLPDDVPPAMLRLLWACRRGMTYAELAAAGHSDLGSVSGAIYEADGRLQLAGPGVRDAVRRQLVADGADRQAAHMELAELLGGHVSAPRQLDELPWQWTEARHWERLATMLGQPVALLALLQQPDRLDLMHWWRAWGLDEALVEWYAERLADWRAAMAVDAFAELVVELCAAFREAGLTGGLGPFFQALDVMDAPLCASLQARVLSLRGSWLMEHGELAAAEKPLRRALALRLETLGADHPQTRTSRHQLATWHEERGELSAAEELYRVALQEREQSLGEHAAGLIPYLTNLGAVLKAMDDVDGAKRCLRRALEIAERQYGNTHPTMAACLDNLAGAVYAEHDYQQAETLYQRALGIAETIFGPTHAATAAAAHNLGAVMDAQQDFRTAEMLFQRALDVREALFGPEHVDTVSSLHNLAGVKDAMGRYDDAEPLYRKAIANWEALVGKDHPATATSVNNLADLLRETGHYDEAEQLYRRNLETWRGLMGEEHPHTLMTLCELAGLYADRKRFRDAEPMLSDAVERTARVLGRDNMDHINAVTRLAALYRDTGRRDEARRLLMQTITAVEGTLGMMSPRVQKLRRHLEALDVDPDRLH
ncbi:tetratricopeptide repeat protein [Aquisalimonas sp.]|uniref:tetratricopeptide repeat protein n=1 Tax=Aquisalimonas sp. TaxID=1872621 RepID=UPI0025C44E9D|nr:tetratricopeptide repeat protein [Aquisalimonas sp.]